MRELLEQSVAFRKDFFEKEAELLKQLTQKQSPKGLFIGCSDSRIVPERLFKISPGDLFMLRNIANIVPPYEQNDIGITAVLEYAIQELKVPHIIICGHTDCGGIHGLEKKSLNSKTRPALASWIEFARPAKQGVDTDTKPNDWDRHRAIVEQNVILQLGHIQTYPFVLEALETNQLELYGWVYYLRRQSMGYYDPDKDEFDILEHSRQTTRK